MWVIVIVDGAIAGDKIFSRFPDASGREESHPSERKSRTGKVGERDPFKLELAALINVKVTVAA